VEGGSVEKFSASVASKHIACHASANLSAAIPNWTPPVEDPNADNAANRGTEMHAMFADVMSLPASDAFKMAKAIEYVATVRQLRRFKVLIEHSMDVDWLQGKPKTTADLVLFTQDELHIIDLKTGKIPVSAFENTQLMYYAVTYAPFAPKAKWVGLHIVQPWANNIERWDVDVARLAQFKQDAQSAELQIRQGSVTFSPGDHCMFCEANPHGRGAKGKPFCPAMMQLLYPQMAVNLTEMLEEE
jgi:hypothetical protein